jgi:predicted transposase/invertase (TIGR01784 family)
MFRVLFNDEEKALRLYGAISGKTFDKETKVEIRTLENVFLSKVRNDLAFTVDGELIVIIEHQSSLNPNMPLRMFQYVFLFYELFYNPGNALYKEKLIKLPKPVFYMLYNGTKPYPASGVIRLSDSFKSVEKGQRPGLELIINVININYGVNMPILDKIDELKGYALFVEKVRRYMADGKKIQAAIKFAMYECLNEGILDDFLKKYKNEVDNMFSLVYDENIAKEVAREEGREDGLEQGLEQGREEGQIQLIERMLLKGKPAEDIAEDTDVPLERIILIKNGLNMAIEYA